MVVTWVGRVVVTQLGREGEVEVVGAGGLPLTQHSPRNTYYTPLAVALPKAGTTYSPLATFHSRRTVASSSRVSLALSLTLTSTVASSS